MSEYSDVAGVKAFLSSEANYPSLKGSKTNLYKYFLPLAFRVASEDGISAFLHPEGVYDDPNGGVLRESIYPRLLCHAQFINWLKLCEDAGAAMSYGLGG